ncbi:hypothetical protein Tco_0727280 [Tanacetum coccineum]|uniref:Uncharacterized protein n=1 Tax=Tanacetum coccineum TaxID=301880 RepID=A0ABQ4YHY1_9ASTR
MGGVLEKDPAPYLTARQEQTVKLLESHKAPFCRYGLVSAHDEYFRKRGYVAVPRMAPLVSTKLGQGLE